MRELPSSQNRIRKRRVTELSQDTSFQMMPGDITGFVKEFGKTHKAMTAERYRKAVLVFYDALPDDKRVYEDTLAKWVQELIGVYSSTHINLQVSACNAFMRYMGRETYQAGYFEPRARSQMELTREEYLRLLVKAKELRKEQVYLCMRLIATAGMEVSDLQALTVEAVKTGEVTTSERVIRLPDGLREELLSYALHNGIRSGQIFISRAGETLNPVTLRLNIKAVSKAAGFEDGKACVRTLQKLYRTSRREAEAKVADLVEQLMLEQIEQEQAEHGWES